MKRNIMACIAFIFILAIALIGFYGGSISKAKTVHVESDYYADAEINSAILSAKLYFAVNFKGCELIEIKYAGDESVAEAQTGAKDSSASKAIILTSSFRVDSSGGDGSLKPDGIYEN